MSICLRHHTARLLIVSTRRHLTQPFVQAPAAAGMAPPTGAGSDAVAVSPTESLSAMFEDNLRKLRERLQQEQEQVGILKFGRRAAGHEREHCNQQREDGAQTSVAGAASQNF